MATEKPWWRMRRVKPRDGVALCVLSSALLLAGELTTTEVGSLRWIYGQYLSTSVANPPLFVFQAVLALFAFTTAFGAILVSLGGWYFLIGRVGRGRFFVGFGVGFTSLTILRKFAYSMLVTGNPVTFFTPLATTLTGLGVLCGAGGHIGGGQCAPLLKKQGKGGGGRGGRSRRENRPD